MDEGKQEADRKTVATIEARMGSTRLPGKVLAPIAGRPLLELIIQRVRAAKVIHQVVVASSVASENEPIQRLAERVGVECVRGSEHDLLGRVLEAARTFDAEDVVALTGDNPLVDPQLIDDVVAFYRLGKYDYVTTTHMHHSRNWTAERTFPVGVSVQAMSVRVLSEAAARTSDPREREFTSFSIYNNPQRYRLGAFEARGRYLKWRQPELRLTVDTPEDLDLMRRIYNALYHNNPLFSTEKAIELVAANPELRRINQHIFQRKVSQIMENLHQG